MAPAGDNNALGLKAQLKLAVLPAIHNAHHETMVALDAGQDFNANDRTKTPSQ